MKKLLLPLLFISLFWTCGEPPPKTDALPAAPAESMQKQARKGRGSIAGAVSLEYPTRSLIYVALGNSYDELSMGRARHGVVLPEPGEFRFKGVKSGTYLVGAFVDINGNRIPDIPLEPYIILPEAISLSPGEHVEGISIDGFFNERDPSFRSPERKEQYGEMAGEAKRLIELAYEKLKDEEGDPLFDTLPSLRAMIYEAEKTWAVAGNDSDWELITALLEQARIVAAGTLEGEDILGTLRGCSLRAYISDLDGSVQPYAIAVPEAYDGSQPFPLIIALHGAGGDHWAGMKMVAGYSAFVVGAKESNRHFFPRNLPQDFIIACPNGHGYRGPGYREKGEYDVMKVLKEMFSNYNIDSDRVYLTGSSKGGSGTWRLGMKYHEMFAAIAPVAGAPHEAEQLVGSTRNLKFHVYHGRNDDIMPVENSRRMVVKLTEAGAWVEYEEFENWGHEASMLAYRDGAIIDRFRE